MTKESIAERKNDHLDIVLDPRRADPIRERDGEARGQPPRVAPARAGGHAGGGRGRRPAVRPQAQRHPPPERSDPGPLRPGRRRHRGRRGPDARGAPAPQAAADDGPTQPPGPPPLRISFLGDTCCHPGTTDASSAGGGASPRTGEAEQVSGDPAPDLAIDDSELGQPGRWNQFNAQTRQLTVDVGADGEVCQGRPAAPQHRRLSIARATHEGYATPTYR